MESRKRRAGKSHYEEELIEKTSKDTSKSSKERGEKAYAPKMGTVINSPAESVLDDSMVDNIIVGEKESKRCCSCSGEMLRMYLITIFTLFFAILSAVIGILLIVKRREETGLLQSGIIALVLAVVLLAPAAYGISRIVKLSRRTYRAKSSKSKDTKKEPYSQVKLNI